MSGLLIDGHLIHYEAWGRGKPLVFVHGWLGSWRYWFPVMEALAVGHRTYALDLWGFGDSEPGPQRFDVPSYVELLREFLNELGIDSVPLVGHTLGAAIVTGLAARHPSWVSRVLAVGLPLTSDAINRKLLTTGSNEALARLFWNRQQPYTEVEGSLGRTARNAMALAVQSVAREDWSEALETIQVPFLGVYGEKDPVINHEACTEVASKNPHVRAIILPGAHHFPMLDQTARFTRLLKDFLEVPGPEQLEELTIKEEWRRRTR